MVGLALKRLSPPLSSVHPSFPYLAFRSSAFRSLLLLLLCYSYLSNLVCFT